MLIRLNAYCTTLLTTFLLLGLLPDSRFRAGTPRVPPLPAPAPATTNSRAADRIYNLVDAWRHAAAAESLPKQATDQGAIFLTDGLRADGALREDVVFVNARGSFLKLIESERSSCNFMDPASFNAYERFLAFSVISACERPPLTNDQSESIKARYCSECTALCMLIRGRLRADLGAHYREMQPFVEQTIDSLEKRLTIRVAELFAEPFFPAFKEQLRPEDARLVEASVLAAPIYPRFEEPMAMMETESESYCAQLAQLPNEAITHYAFYMTEVALRSTLPTHQYWNKLQLSVAGTAGYIPVDVRLGSVEDLRPSNLGH